MVKNLPNHINEESLGFMTNRQGYPCNYIKIQTDANNLRNAIVYFDSSAEGLSWVKLNQVRSKQ